MPYAADMDWQAAATWAIIAITAGVFLRKLVKRRGPFPAGGGGCGCAGGAGNKSSIVVCGRKGERPRVIVKAK